MLYSRKLRRLRPRPSCRRHLDEAFVWIGGMRMYLWRAVDDEGEVLDILVQAKRDKRSTLKLMRKLLKKYCFAAERWLTDKLSAYGATLRQLGADGRHLTGGSLNNRAENSHLPVRQRERRMQRATISTTLLSTHAVHDTFAIQRHLISRRTKRPKASRH
jgi:putative transposase